MAAPFNPKIAKYLSPVLTGKGRMNVSWAISLQNEAMRDAPDWRTRVWVAGKALEWMHFNAVAFVSLGSRGEVFQRQLFGRLWQAVDAHLSPVQAAQLRRLSNVLSGLPRERTDRDFVAVLGRPHQVANFDELWPRMRAAIQLNAAPMLHIADADGRVVWWVITTIHAFDLMQANPELCRTCPDAIKTTLKAKAVEIGEAWPAFPKLYANLLALIQ